MNKGNPPLPKEELKEMHGEPVWLRNDFGNGYWFIVDAICECFVGTTYFKESKEDRAPIINGFDILDKGWTAHLESLEDDWHGNPFPYRNLDKEPADGQSWGRMCWKCS